MTVKQCFTSCHCTCGDCPNVQYDIANNRYGFGIAEDMGLEKISCKECRYNTGKCKDCLFFTVLNVRMTVWKWRRNNDYG